MNPINILYALQEFALFACNKLKQIFLFFAWISAPDTFRTYTAGMNECQTLSSPYSMISICRLGCKERIEDNGVSPYQNEA